MTYNVISTVCQNVSRPIVPRLVCLCLFVLIVWQLTSGMVSIFSFNKFSSTTPIVIKTPPSQRISNAGLTKTLFGEYIPSLLNDIDVKQSMLDFKVVGIMLAPHEEDSQVILNTSGKHDQTFNVGSTLPGGAVIKRITENGVFVERKGQLESLSFPKNELIFEVQAKPLVEDE